MAVIFSVGCEDQTKIVEPQNYEYNGDGSLDMKIILDEVEAIIPFSVTRFIHCANGGIHGRFNFRHLNMEVLVK
jgi:hypothetical protein